MTHGTEKEEIREGVALAKKKGRKGDTTLGHLSHGDLVIPRGQVTPKMRAFMNEFFDVDRYTVGHEANSKNPNTGLPEFYDDNALGGWGFDIGDMGTGTNVGTGLDIGGWADGMMGGGTVSGITESPDPALQGFPISTPTPAQPASQPNTGWSLGSFFDELANKLGPPTMAPTSDGVAGGNGPGSDNPGGSAGGGGGVLESTLDPLKQFVSENPQFFQQTPTAPGRMPGLPVNQLAAPVAPDIPDTYADIGNYFTQKGLGNADFARNLLAPYLQGDKNVYGR